VRDLDVGARRQVNDGRSETGKMNYLLN
jgi:hypothetical protein